MNDIERHKLKKMGQATKDMGEYTAMTGAMFAEGLFRYAYNIKEDISQMEVNQRNIGKLNQ